MYAKVLVKQAESHLNGCFCSANHKWHILTIKRQIYTDERQIGKASQGIFADY